MPVPPYPVVTISGVAYDVFATVATANAYLAADPKRAALWAGTDTNTKARGLVGATRSISRRRFRGAKTTAGNAWPMPRTGLSDREGIAIASDAIPPDIVNATILLAYDITRETSLVDGQSTGGEVESIRDGALSVSYFERSRSEKAAEFAPHIMDLLVPYLAREITAPIVPGGEDPVETDKERYTVTEGFA